MRERKIAVTLGDPSGIGPEVVIKALARHPPLAQSAIVIGNRRSLIEQIRDMGLDRNVVDSVDFRDIEGGEIEVGRTQKEAGRIAIESIQLGVDLINRGEAHALCTAPINKEAIALAGSRDIDHTSMLSRLTHSSRVSTVFETRKLRVLFASKHISLKEAISSISVKSLQEAIENGAFALKSLGISGGRIAVAALNPHAGENGLLGREELDIIAPAIQMSKKSIDVYGPFPADSIFHRAAEGEFDLVISLYHDQGHIASKMLDFQRTVSMNIGLPFLRASVDHGTAFDIAGQNRASPLSMISALKATFKYYEIYRKNYIKFSGRRDPGNHLF